MAALSSTSAGAEEHVYVDETGPHLTKHAAERVASLKAELAKDQPVPPQSHLRTPPFGPGTYQPPTGPASQQGLGRGNGAAAPSEATPLNSSAKPDGGQWADGLCNCCADFPMCMLVFCLPAIPLGQLYERAVMQRMIHRRFPMSCLSICTCTTLAYTLSSILNVVAEAETDADYNPTPTSVALNTITFVLGLCISSCAFFIVCCVRKAVRRRHNIKPQCCGDAEDCCCAFFCNHLTQCQIWRHESVFWGKNYKICSPIAV